MNSLTKEQREVLWFLNILVQGSVLQEAWDYLLEKKYIDRVISGEIDAETLADEYWRLQQVAGVEHELREKSPKMFDPKDLSQADIQYHDSQIVLSVLLAKYASSTEKISSIRKTIFDKYPPPNQYNRLSLNTISDWIISVRNKEESKSTNELHNDNIGFKYIESESPFVKIILVKRSSLLGEIVKIANSHIAQPNYNYSFGAGIKSDMTNLPIEAKSWDFVAVSKEQTEPSYDIALIINNEVREIFPWTEAATITFILTGLIPQISMIETTLDSNIPTCSSRIVMRVDPTTAPDDVISEYRKARKDFIAGRSRSLSEKHLRLALFSALHEELSNRQLLVKWNKQYPQWKYPKERLNLFSRDYRTAQDRLLNPSYQNSITGEPRTLYGFGGKVYKK